MADSDIESFVPCNKGIYICNLSKKTKYNLNDLDIEKFHKLKLGEKIKFETINIGHCILEWNLNGLVVKPNKKQKWHLVKTSDNIPMYKLSGGEEKNEK
ncbi:MAG TPA: hypothetical protein PKD85_00890 [Saprospiraceae bacterium]|nr:hypothetical protein [Saprospiraceae bacterium]